MTPGMMNLGVPGVVVVGSNIARHHGGDIRLHSRVGQGTTFEVLLPVARVPA